MTVDNDTSLILWHGKEENKINGDDNTMNMQYQIDGHNRPYNSILASPKIKNKL